MTAPPSTDRIRHVIFDFGGVVQTILDRGLYEEELTRCGALLGLTDTAPLACKDLFYASEEWREAKVGRMTSIDFFRSICERHNVTALNEIKSIRHRIRTAGRGVDLRMKKLVLELRNLIVPEDAEYRDSDAPWLRSVGMLSNFEDDFGDMLSFYGLSGSTEPPSRTAGDADPLAVHSPFFSPLLYSAHMRMAKPSEECFRLLLSALKNPPPSQVLFIDDKQRNVDAAAALGIVGIVYDNFEQASQQIRSVLGLRRPADANDESAQ